MSSCLSFVHWLTYLPETPNIYGTVPTKSAFKICNFLSQTFHTFYLASPSTAPITRRFSSLLMSSFISVPPKMIPKGILLPAKQWPRWEEGIKSEKDILTIPYHIFKQKALKLKCAETYFLWFWHWQETSNNSMSACFVAMRLSLALSTFNNTINYFLHLAAHQTACIFQMVFTFS